MLIECSFLLQIYSKENMLPFTSVAKAAAGCENNVYLTTPLLLQDSRVCQSQEIALFPLGCIRLQACSIRSEGL